MGWANYKRDVLYKGGHSNAVAQIMNGFWEKIASLGLLSNWVVTLEVTGRKSGKKITLPVVTAIGIWFRCWGKMHSGYAMYAPPTARGDS
jgi:hypothetical protein